MSQGRQRGMTIVELMIAMIIAMIILLAVSRVYVGSVGTQRAQSEVTRLNESARFAHDLLSRHLRNAGFSNTWQLGATTRSFCAAQAVGRNIVALNDPATINPASADFTGSPTLAIYSPATNQFSDVVRVRYFGEDTTSTAAVLDCQGYPVAANTLVEDTLFVAANPANGNEPALFCNTTNPTNVTATHPGYVPMVSGVESFQVIYGEDIDADGIVNRYVPAHLVTNWDNVLSAKVSVVVRSPNSVSSDGTPRPAMHHFHASYPAVANTDPGAVFPAAGVDVPNDGRARLMISAEVAIRNNAYCE